MTGVILWDFDGTLAFRPGMWRGCLIEILDEHAAGHGVDADLLRPERSVDAGRGWRRFDDTLPVLRRLRSEGWCLVILSNHVPELPAMANALGLDSLIDEVHTSAAMGYEKPNRKSFEIALESCGRPDQVWMVGDNPVADAAGAEAVGISAILVRSEASGVPRQAQDLHQAASIIVSQSRTGAAS